MKKAQKKATIKKARKKKKLKKQANEELCIQLDPLAVGLTIMALKEVDEDNKKIFLNVVQDSRSGQSFRPKPGPILEAIRKSYGEDAAKFTVNYREISPRELLSHFQRIEILPLTSNGKVFGEEELFLFLTLMEHVDLVETVKN